MTCLGWAGVLAAHRRLYWAAYPTGGSMLPPTPFGGWGGPKKLPCSRSVRLGCWVGLGANTPCTLWYGGVGIVSVIHRSTESHRRACALGVASESVSGAARRAQRPCQQAPPRLRRLRTPPNYYYLDCILRTAPRIPLDQYPRRGKG